MFRVIYVQESKLLSSNVLHLSWMRVYCSISSALVQWRIQDFC